MVPPSDMSAKARARAQDMVAYGQRQVDRVMSPPARQRAYDSVYAFASARPILSSFLLTQALFSLLPLLFFSGFVLSAAAALLFCFTLFWAGVAALFLFPALLVTSGLALLAWAWGLAVFYAARATYRSLPAGVRGDAGALMKRMPSFSGREDERERKSGNVVVFEQRKANGDRHGSGAGIKVEEAEVEE
ncbi:hypothetical protein F4810DRAFT_94698 [Camillea tinctor]|nr:hypothetical protein F4810DRAFT_94698 [Camillea tinctor]